MTIMEREVCKAKDEGRDTISWLELDELGIDGDMLLSLDLPSKFHVFRAREQRFNSAITKHVQSRFPSQSMSNEEKNKTDASDGRESKHQQKLQSDEMGESEQLICKDVIRQEDMKSWIERYRSLELEKIKDIQTIKQLREELAQVTKSKDAIIAEYFLTKTKDSIIAEYFESPAFTKRLDEEHEKRLSEIFHPCYVKALRTVQTKSLDTVQTESPGIVHTKLPDIDSPLNFHRATGGFDYKAY